MTIPRDKYLEKLISKMHNKQVKVITGIRRCGKSFLLKKIFYEYLLSKNIAKDHIVVLTMDNIKNSELIDPKKLYEFVKKKIKDSKMYYVFIDEIQEVKDFVKVLNGWMEISNLDVYVTGSNSKFLSRDIATEFRGRGDQIHLYPLTFNEFYSTCNNLSFDAAFNEYLNFGGMPHLAKVFNEEDKISYLKNLSNEVYIKDIEERYKIKNINVLSSLLNYLASNIGSLTNPLKLTNYFKTNLKTEISKNTIESYLKAFEDSFLIYKSMKFDIKGKKYISTPYKYYFSDMGLRNVRLDFRQIEENHIMENIIYNELLYRGFLVDVGSVEVNELNSNGNYVKKSIEIDFVANRGNNRIYIQSVYNMLNNEKILQEKRPFLKTYDSFKKIIIVRDNIKIKRDDQGIITISLKDFLLKEKLLEEL